MVSQAHFAAFFDCARAQLKPYALGLTSLQRHELLIAVQAHQNANAVDNPSLVEQRAAIDEHWKLVSSTLILSGFTAFRLHGLGQSLLASIYNEYFVAELPSPVTLTLHQFLGALGTSSQRQLAANEAFKGDLNYLDSQYQTFVLFATKEYMLDPEHVEHRLRAALNKQNLTKSLLDLGDELGLSQLIEKDLAIVQQVVLYLPDQLPAANIIKIRANTLIKQLQAKSKAQAQTQARPSSFWSDLTTRLGLSNHGTTTTPDDLSETIALLSPSDHAKKTV